ncbi:GNAT family N-acetyltransferase [Chryseobacterium rhizosphaerae]|jgi:putative acetyltransferase|uniref:GNAT family N-acetyltransferase n=1 Tax=Chryseobacterium rhizosphaerae TaxID=395937 RepID=A0ABX9IHI1_9FLAO|nr:GNAT family N-acetyltransferase [Chryseobacterium rhizosphaerae]REC73705.1 GNAT family N-acetyltransferase [Chryseobacterium rhizosphaerae]GEN69245.1 GCN5 family N-acetyltransferase [Chryseobacterium rhizosphaerae]
MSHQIRLATSEDYPKIMEIWESAVKATHDFLSEEDFTYFKEAIPRDYLPNLEVYLIIENGESKGFSSVAEGNLEMLFIHNEVRGKGYGKVLYQFMKEKTGLTKVDVNEQNPQAIGFYEKMGFQPVGRSEKDGSGKEYPIIHMSL